MKVLIVMLCLVISCPAYSYVGPGLGAGTIGVILGIIGSVLIALFAILWYPFKRLLKKMKKNSKARS